MNNKIKRNTKKLCAIMLSICCFLVCTFNVYAFESDELIQNEESVYSNEFSETVIIESESYTYHYFLDDNGNKVVQITNDKTGNTDNLQLDKNTGEFYLNNSLIGECGDKLINSSDIRFRTTWNYVDSYSQYISWAMGTSVAIVAGMVAAALGGPVALVVTGASIFAAACSGGTLYWTQWYSVDNRTRLRTSWGFSANTGDYYGPWEYIISR